MLLFVIYILQTVLFAVIATSDGDVRLAHTRHTVSAYSNKQYVFGRVEVSCGSEWGTVCWDRWSSFESRTVCAEIGYDGSAGEKRASRNDVVQDRGILMDNFYCYREKKLIECRNNGCNNVRRSCTHYDDVWVKCYRYLPSYVSDLPIRLIDNDVISGYNSANNTYVGEHSVIHAGLLQAKYQDIWYYVSGVGWDTMDARVVCGQLGYPEVSSIPEYSPAVALSYSQLINVAMENLDCIGNERELKECYHSGWLFGGYNVTDLAAVNCVTRERFLSSRQTEFRLRSGSNYWEGRLEVLHELSWGSVCGKGFTLSHGDIACRSLGFGRALEVFQTASNGYGRGVGMIWIGDFECSNPLTATSLLECDSSNWEFSSCRYDHAFDVGIRCQVPTPEKKVRVLEEYTARRYNTAPGVRFYFIEFLHEDRWESPCCYTLLLRSTIDTLCGELGLGFGVYHLSTCAKFPYSRRQTGLDGFILCSRNDYFSENCFSIFDVTQSCYNGYYHTIACAERLPDLVPDLLFFERSLRYYSSEAGEVVFDNRAKNRIEYSRIGNLTCAIEDECLATSTHRDNPDQEVRLLRFSSLTNNYGLLTFYPPVPQGQWVWHNCHEHFHSMEVFVTYHLLDRGGRRVAEGHKASFCLEDSTCDDADPFFHCDESQGISVNCGDHYGAELDCQWIDITGVPPGNYTVELTVNPRGFIQESDYENNVLSCMVELDTEGYYSTYNCLHSDHILEEEE